MVPFGDVLEALHKCGRGMLSEGTVVQIGAATLQKRVFACLMFIDLFEVTALEIIFHFAFERLGGRRRIG